MNPFDDPALATARTNAQNAQQAAQQSQQADITLPDMLRSALTSKFSADNPLFANREAAAKNYLDSTTNAPLSVLPENNNGIVFNPIQQANLIQQRQSSALAPLLTANSLLGLVTGGLDTVINSTSNAHKAQTQSLLDAASLAHTGYTDLLDELSKKADYALRLASLGNTPQLQSQNLVRDLQNGMVLRDALTKYAGKLTPDQIYSAYNSVNYGTNKTGKFNAGAGGYGTARENIQELTNLGIKNLPSQSSQTANATLQMLESINPKLFNKTGPIAGTTTKLFAGKLDQFTDPELMKLQSNLGPIREQVINIISGANVSKGEADRVLSWIPDISKTPEKNKADLNSLRNWLSSRAGQGISSGNPLDALFNSSNTGGWEIVQ